MALKLFLLHSMYVDRRMPADYSFAPIRDTRYGTQVTFLPSRHVLPRIDSLASNALMMMSSPIDPTAGVLADRHRNRRPDCVMFPPIIIQVYIK